MAQGIDIAKAPLITPVILSGGAGTRLWPMSRAEQPKQFLPLTAAHSMFQLTAKRCDDLSRFNPPIIVAGARHADMIAAQLNAIDIVPGAIILEPCARNTAPAIALAALLVAGDVPLLVMPSDHVIENEAAFGTAIAAAMPLVDQGWLVTFGITPTGPETGYGYIQTCDVLDEGVHRVSGFTEKPDAARATAMLLEGDYFWNGGIFLFRADAYLENLALYAPAILTSGQQAMGAAKYDGVQIMPGEGAFAESSSDSIDYAVMEKAERVAVVPVSMGWSDVGSWDALYGLGIKDAGGNVSDGDVTALDTSNCLIRTDGLRIATVGVSDLIIVASGDTILIMPRGRSQDVKALTARIKP